jgi:hypothetical protein
MGLDSGVSEWILSLLRAQPNSYLNSRELRRDLLWLKSMGIEPLLPFDAIPIADDAAKLQGLARPHGGVLFKVELISHWENDASLLEKFPTEGNVSMSHDELLQVRAISGVIVNSRSALVSDTTRSVRNP